MEQTEKFFIIDFDSTFIQTEGLETLAEIILQKNPQKTKILTQIREIANLGMEGKISLEETLEKRLNLLTFHKSDLLELIKVLKKKITPSFKRNKKFFKQFKNNIYIISGGFKEFIFPVVEEYGILEKNILANEFLYDKKGNITGFDKTKLTAKSGGKAQAIKDLKIKGEVIIIGDGFTDLEARNLGGADKFVAFSENVSRDIVTENADRVVKNFDEFLYFHNLPRSLSYPKSKIKVLLLENIDTQAIDIFKKEGYQVEEIKRALDEDELAEKIKDISILGIRSKTKVTKKVLENAEKLKAVGTFTIGIDQMDLSALLNFGVAVFNAPYQNTRSVVELVIGEMIMLMRGVVEKNNQLHKGSWEKSAKGSNEIRGKTLGIIGYGSIGSQLSVLAENLGMDVIFYDKVEKLALGNAKRASSMDEVLKKADVVSIHVSGDKTLNTNLISEKEFAKMKNGVIFLNLARGFIVDIKALVKNIKSGKIRGAGIDVFPDEPKSKGDPFASELQGLPNVIITPHIAGSTEEAQRNIAEFVSGKLIDFMNTGNTNLSVNFPNITLPEQGSSHRLLHLHKNMLGILSKINSVLASHNINILGQYLKTNEEVGYVITDVNKAYNKEVIEEMKKIEGTIRLRVLY